jgi:hypothetical protein
MAKYMLKRGIARLPIDGVREIQREGLPPLKQTETVVFEAGKVVDTDLDFGSWVEDGTLVRIREQGEPPRPPKPTPVPVAKKEILMPMPSFVQVEVIKEEAKEESKEEAKEEAPVVAPASAADEPTERVPTEDISTEESVTDGNTPVETPRQRRRR